MFLVQRFELGNLVAAGMAPRRPDVEQNDLALECRERGLCATECLRRVRRCRRADRDGAGRLLSLAGAAARDRSTERGQREGEGSAHYLKLESGARATRTADGRPGCVHAK